MNYLSHHQIFQSFHLRNFRALLVSQALTDSAQHMEIVVLGWFVLQKTDSPFYLGLLGACRFVGTIAAPLSGVAADRLNRRNLLVGLHGIYLLAAGGMVVLALGEWVEPWHALVAATLGGSTRASEIVPRQALVADVVDRAGLLNAIALLRTIANLGFVIGPVMGGALLATMGLGPAYIVVFGMYLVSASAIYLIRLQGHRSSISSASPWRDMVAAGGYIRGNRVIFTVLLLAGLVNLTLLPLLYGLMPVFARDVLGTESTGLGVLLATVGIGAVAGSVLLASVRNFRKKGRFFIVAILAWHVLYTALFFSSWFPLALMILGTVGITLAFWSVLSATFLLTATAPEFLGRVHGIRAFVVLVLPLGMLFFGGLMEGIGAPITLVIMGAVGGVLTLAILLGFRSLWNAE